MMRLLLLMLLALVFSCQPDIQPSAVIGSWKVDSSYLYYNGFGKMIYKDQGDWAVLDYRTDGVLSEAKFGTAQEYRYTFNDAGDTIHLKDRMDYPLLDYQVLKLNAELMILKKHKKPIYPGKNQERYEVRFFSRYQNQQ